jgi:transposase
MNPKQTEGVRRRRSRAEIEQLLKEYEASGLGRQAFRNKYGLSLSTLSRHQKRNQLRAESARASRLLPVEIAPAQQAEATLKGGELHVCLSTGRKIEVCGGFDPQVLRQLVRVLEQAWVFGLGRATRIYLAAGATDMRKGFEGLYGLVRDRLACDPLSGHVFLFSNAQRNRLKLLFYDGSGLWVCAKRLDRGRFRWPAVESEQVKVVLSPEELVLLLGGIDLSQAERRRWHRVMTTPENIPT